ncbi:MAG: protein-L-isoaspartate(D-aspartate) O-methyltransferase [Methylococcaceae bacterium]|nr:protein-L-isoaspartate(D-aspartate) O-methyltransferase [Methylococcaceae bacterium]
MAAGRRDVLNLHHQGIGLTSRRTRDRLVERLKDQGIRNVALLEVIRNTPRHIFVEEALAGRAYEDTALPIGHNQTISQPYIVAKMTELLLEKAAPEKILEIGTGSGYQTAVLAQLVEKLYTVERIFPLMQRARRCLHDLRLHNVSFRHSDGGWGRKEFAPYDGILVTAAPPEIPAMLLEQLKIGGVMVLPVGSGAEQSLQRVVKTQEGCVMEVIEPVRFVPLVLGRY